MAGAIANEGVTAPNVDPADRVAFEQLQRVAEMHVGQLTGLTPTGTLTLVSRSQWTADTIDAYRPLFEQLAGSFDAMLKSQLDNLGEEDLEALNEMSEGQLGPNPRMFVNAMSQMLGPMMLTMMAGSMVGQLGRRAFGSYDLPIPRAPESKLLVVADAIDQFGRDWSLEPDDLRLWVSIGELTTHTVLTLPHVHAHMMGLLCRHAAGFTGDLSGLEDRLGDIDPMSPDGMERLQAVLGDPEVVLGAMRTDEQAAVLPSIDAVVCVMGGYVDWVVDRIGSRLLGDHVRITEALRRRRVETDQSSRFVERLFGLELTQDVFDRGAAFIDGVVQRAGEDALARLWTDAESLPTPAEVIAPGLWLARLGLAQADLEGLGDIEVPDSPEGFEGFDD
jgi:putative hydrolase